MTYQNLRKPEKSTAGGFTSTLSRYCEHRLTVVRGNYYCRTLPRVQAEDGSRKRTSRVWYSLMGLMKHRKSKSSSAPPPTHRYSLCNNSYVPAIAAHNGICAVLEDQIARASCEETHAVTISLSVI